MTHTSPQRSRVPPAVQEAGRALRLTAKMGVTLFPEVPPAEQGSPQRVAVTAIDEKGASWSMAFVCKRYSVG